jgi:hypothetical protein
MKPPARRGLCWFWLLAVASAMALAAYGGVAGGKPVALSRGLRVWLDQPSDGATLPAAMLTLRAHARDAGGSAVETLTFLVSSGGPPFTVASIATNPTQPLVTAAFDSNLCAPGEYAIQSQAFNHLGYLFSAAIAMRSVERAVELADRVNGALACSTPGRVNSFRLSAA